MLKHKNIWIFIILSIFNFKICFGQNVHYQSGTDALKDAKAFSKKSESACRYLEFRDLPDIFKKYQIQGNALDYGMGTGDSTLFLLKHGFTIQGVDIDQKMLSEAKQILPADQHEKLYLTKLSGPLPFKDNSFDLVFSSMVLMELSSKEAIQQYLTEAYRVLKPGGYLVALTGSEHLHNPQMNWSAIESNFPENANLKSGQRVKCLVKDIGIVFEDFYWTHQDYQNLFANSRFYLIQTHHPLGLTHEDFPWKAELKYSPTVIYVARK